jgi:hypothetical protein
LDRAELKSIGKLPPPRIRNTEPAAVAVVEEPAAAVTAPAKLRRRDVRLEVGGRDVLELLGGSNAFTKDLVGAVGAMMARAGSVEVRLVDRATGQPVAFDQIDTGDILHQAAAGGLLERAAAGAPLRGNG